MKVAELVAHLLKLDQAADIKPTWEGYCPGDFGGLCGQGAWVGDKWERRPGYWLICEPEGAEPVWTIEPEDSP